MIHLKDSPEVNAALSLLMQVASQSQAGSAATYLLQIHRRIVEVDVNRVSKIALFDETAKASALKLLGKLEAYEEIITFINNLKA